MGVGGGVKDSKENIFDIFYKDFTCDPACCLVNLWVFNIKNEHILQPIQTQRNKSPFLNFVNCFVVVFKKFFRKTSNAIGVLDSAPLP